MRGCVYVICKHYAILCEGFQHPWNLASTGVLESTPHGFGGTNVLVPPTDSEQFSSVAQSCPMLCDPMDCSVPGFPFHHQLPELPQTHVHQVGDAIQPSHPLSSPSPPAFSLFQHKGLFQCVSSSSQGAKILEFQLQHQSFQ